MLLEVESYPSPHLDGIRPHDDGLRRLEKLDFEQFCDWKSKFEVGEREETSWIILVAVTEEEREVTEAESAS